MLTSGYQPCVPVLTRVPGSAATLCPMEASIMPSRSRVLALRAVAAAVASVLLAVGAVQGRALEPARNTPVPDVVVGAPHVPMYHVTDLGTLSGDTQSEGGAINAAGDVTGESTDVDYSVGQAFRYHDGTLTGLGVLNAGDVSAGAAINASGEVAGVSSGDGGDFATTWSGTTITDISSGVESWATGINDDGDVVGSMYTTDLLAFVDTGGPLVDLNSEVSSGATGMTLIEALAINGTGEIVGFGATADGPTHAFLFDAGKVTDLGTPGNHPDDMSSATAINAAGHVVGWTDGTTSGAFYWNGTMHVISVASGPGGDMASGINAADWVVGFHDTGAGTTAFVWPGAGSAVDLNTRALDLPAGWTLTGANAINDSGQIAATASIDEAGDQHAVRLTPAAVTRLAGSTRFQTAAAISANAFPVAGSADVAYVANAYNFPDALGGAAAAGTVHGPVLLAAATLPLDPATTAELTRLKPARIIVLGGTGAISDAVKAALLPFATTHEVDRYGGSTRFATAATISANTWPVPGSAAVAYIANAYNFPDALGAAAAAGTVKGPVLLASATLPLDAFTTAELTRLQPAKIVVVGGSSVISDAVKAALVPLATTHAVDRYSGTTRFATAANISFNTFSPGVPAIYLANAYNFPDALGGAAAAGTLQGPVLLVGPNLPLDPATLAEIVRLTPQHIYVLGGTGVLSDAVLDAVAPYATGP